MLKVPAGPFIFGSEDRKNLRVAVRTERNKGYSRRAGLEAAGFRARLTWPGSRAMTVR